MKLPLPTPLQTLLLRAALLDGADGVAAWQAWHSQVDIQLDHLDAGSFRLLPRVYHNLQKHGVNDPLLPLLKGIYRRAWAQNQLLLAALTTLLQAIQTDHITTLLLPGTTLSLLYPAAGGLRPLERIDLFVPAQQIDPALDCLAKLGWQSAAALPRRATATQRLHNNQGQQLDLYTVLFENRSLIEDSTTVTLAGANTRQFTPTALLFYLCTQAAHWNLPAATIDWMSDALTVLKLAGDQIDWSLLLQQATIHHVGYRLRNRLNCLSTTFPATIPPTVQQQLIILPISNNEKVEQVLRTKTPLILQKVIARFVGACF